MDKTMVELFAGVGGFRLGLERLDSGWNTVWFSQWEPGKKKQWAHDCYVAHFGDCEDINGEYHTGEDISSIQKENIPDHTLLVGGFPCFPEGTLVLTTKGFVPIENIQVGDMVLTHKGRWKKVLKTGSQIADTITLYGQGSVGIECTPNHPFLTRTKKRINSRKSDLYGKHILQDDESWTNAEDCEGKFWANIYGIDSLDIPPIGKMKNADADSLLNNPEFWYFVGRWVGDGCLSFIEKRKDKRILLSCSFDKIDDLKPHLEKSGLHFSCRKDRTEYNFSFSSISMYNWLEENFGKGAINKTVPAWIFGAPQEIKTMFLRGYMDADGSFIKEKRAGQRYIEHYKATTISKKLLIGLKILFEQLGYSVSLGKYDPGNKSVIEGRTVNVHMTYTIRACMTNRTSVHCNNIMWGKIRKIKEGRKNIRVYKMMVEDDHSYTIDGIIVKNCQDYSVAHSLSTSKGIEGKKGVLWWQIRDVMMAKKPAFCLFENVDRLLKSPAKQRGRDFGIILACLSELGYSAEWRVVNAALYGAAQRRRRIFIFAYRDDSKYGCKMAEKDAKTILDSEGFMAKAFPIISMSEIKETVLPDDIVTVSDTFAFPFGKTGYMTKGHIFTTDIAEEEISPILLGDILENDVDDHYYIPEEKMPKWEYLKGSKKIERTSKSGHQYVFSEGPVAFPDPWDRPGRTMLTSESTLNRSTHVVTDKDTEKLRILTPVEAERLQGFDDNWTNTGMPERMRYFCMGNALVVPMITRMGKVLDEIIEGENKE